jgi:cation transport regulator
MMPYKTIGELPESVRSHLPKHAQEIYRAAFNSAWDEYGQDEERAHRVAWAAVKTKYEKDEQTGEWREKRE